MPTAGDCPAMPTVVQYAIVTNLQTLSLWPKAVEALQSKYELKWPGKVLLEVYDDAVTSGIRACLPALRRHLPSYTCFLQHRSLCTGQLVRDVHQLTRELDPSTPYTDTVWGILTGYEEEDVLFALRQPPLTVRRGTGNSPMCVAHLESGLWFSEGERGLAIRKLPTESSSQREKCPNDASKAFVEELSSWRDIEKDEGIDFIGTSGHASATDLSMGYSFKSGSICSEKGWLFSCPLNKSESIAYVKRNESPKILSAAGNCCMGHIVDENSMALAWMHSASVVQMTGYIVSTWFGYGGWGVNTYLCKEPGAMTFSEAFFANQQALLYTLHSKYGDASELVRQTSEECRGLIYDRDVVAFYGDPAWSAALPKNSSHSSYTHTITQTNSVVTEGWIEWKYCLTTKKSGRWVRPPVYVFPSRVQDAHLVFGDGVLTCRFLLLPLSGSYRTGEEHTVTYRTLL